ICFLISYSTYAGTLSLEVLSPYTYGKLSKASQQKYSKKIQSAWLGFEKSYKIPHHKSSFMNSVLFEAAFAESTQCIIGGNVLTAVTSGKHAVCPTTTRKCEGHSDGFECGDIFGKTCISRTPISNLSERCFNESKTLTT